MNAIAPTKTRNAVLLSVCLGIISAVLTAASFYAAGITFLIFSLLNPLIVSLVVPARSTSLSILANTVLVFMLPIIVGLVLLILRVPWTGLPRGGSGELVAGFLLALAVALTFAWIISALVRLVRRKLRKEDLNPEDPAATQG